jgi:hypothetical protein
VSPTVNRKRGRKPKKGVEDVGEEEKVEEEEEDKEVLQPRKKIKMEPGELDSLLRGVGAQFQEYDGHMAHEDI